MVPLQLRLKNFMCYREDVPPLHFEGVHVACLCGDNGHGKTALLDAITWALWGTARATLARNGSISAPNVDDLIHQGQSDMSVELDFMARGQRYRVVRRRSVSARSRSGRTTLELQVATADGDGSFRSISGNRVQETSARISQILNMDFKTFVNTAYLSQGQADVFTTSTPAERKKCLSDVLDLSYYERLSDGARSRSNGINGQMQDMRTAIRLHGDEVAQKPEYERQLEDVRLRIADTAPQAAEQRKAAERLSGRVQSLEAQQTEFDELEQRLHATESDAANLQRQIGDDEQVAKTHAATIEDEKHIREGFAELERTQSELGRLNVALSHKSKLDTDRSGLTQAIARQEERLSAECRNLQSRITDTLEPQASRLPAINSEIAGLEKQRSALGERAEAIEKQRRDAEAITVKIQDLKQHNTRLMQEMQDTRKKFDMLNEGDTICPLCEQQLGERAQQHLRREYRRLGEASKASYESNRAEIAALNQQQKAAADRLTAMETSHASDGRKFAGREANLARDKGDSIAAQQELEQARKALSEKAALLRNGAFAEQERRSLAALDEALAELEYDPEMHEQMRRHVGTLEHFGETKRRLDEALANLPQIRERLQTSRQMLANRRDEIEAATERISTLEQDLETLPSLRDALKEAVASRNSLEDTLRKAEVDQGVLEDRIANCDKLAAEIAALEQEHRRLADEKSVYDELTAAFGKNGIQALVIESAIPQLQDDANEILSRVTEHRMHLRLELDEGTSERLEIRIADELGTRDYQTFSGGEAFRINFALRIALSKLLARRSGAPLPVLFIDEGFGSQDRSGQERLTEAIQSIQDEFEKIIVITHINQLKEAFPVRIEVTKTENGSSFAVI